MKSDNKKFDLTEDTLSDDNLFEIWWLNNRHLYSRPPYELAADDRNQLMKCDDFRRYKLNYYLNRVRVSIENEMEGVGNFIRRIFRLSRD